MMQQSTTVEGAVILAALGSEHRLRIIELLREGERCVCEITPEFELDPSVVSRHLSVLEQAGAIRSRRDGRRIYYQIADARILRLFEIARQIAETPEKAKPVGPQAQAAKC
jgi:DNA-binding transcriptional ArsR family regulator